ncbi:MAG: hypothetical protein ACK56F_08965, partial [bacterium]
EEWRMAVLRWHVQGVPFFQEEVPDVPSQLPSGYSPEGTRADVQGELPARQDSAQSQEGRGHAHDLEDNGHCL